MAKRRKSRKVSSRKLPSWKEVRAGLLQATKSKLVLCIGRIYLSRATPKSVKAKIVSVAKGGVVRVTKKARKVKRRSTSRKSKSRKVRTPAQRRATRKLVALNKRRRR